MKLWTGGTVVIILAALLSTRYLLYSSFSPNQDNPISVKKSLIPKAPIKRTKLNSSHSFFSNLNFTQPIHNPNLIWAHMLPLLSRADNLPAAADGAKEAAKAWKELMSDVKEEEKSKIESKDIKKCPFLVSGNANLVDIPCGLVQDSAVTIVGVALENNRSSVFGFELVGSNGEIVVRVNVSVEGENVVVSHSSWKVETGWAAWEFCPGHALDANASNHQVDGLVRCNHGLSNSMVQENPNGTLTDGKKLSKQANRIVSANSPFVSGNPFIATLWAGIEGFHLTVNGRHETSYMYRERLDPWLVSKVRVDGDVDLMSILINGLPVSEDLDLANDVQRLKAPPLSMRRIFLLIGIISSANNFERRMALRRSWMQYEAVRTGIVAVRFLTGLHKNEQVNLELWKEADTYGDIQLMPFVDYYSLITLKTVAVCVLGTKVIPAKYIMKTDDDAFVRVDEVLNLLKKITANGVLCGLISSESSPERDKESKWYISPEEWPHETYPPWAHGPGYIISRDIAKFIVRGHQQQTLKLFKLEDVAMGIWIQEYKNSGEEVHYVNDDRFHNAGCDTDYILAHYQGPRLLLCLWDKLQKEQKAICCEISSRNPNLQNSGGRRPPSR